MRLARPSYNSATHNRKEITPPHSPPVIIAAEENRKIISSQHSLHRIAALQPLREVSFESKIIHRRWSVPGEKRNDVGEVRALCRAPIREWEVAACSLVGMLRKLWLVEGSCGSRRRCCGSFESGAPASNARAPLPVQCRLSGCVVVVDRAPDRQRVSAGAKEQFQIIFSAILFPG